MIVIDKLSVQYSDGKQVLHQVSCRVNDGESVGIIGANGAGKSTLLKSFVGLLMPSQGRIEIHGVEVNQKNVRKIREMVGVVFQNPDDQLFMSNVYDDIAFGPRNYGMTEEWVKQRIYHMFHAFGIEHLEKSHSNKLSGGEKRIVAIATALVMEPSILLFDEPTSFLDPRMRRRLIELLKELEMTKIIATHDLDMALELCDRVIILKEGSIYAEGQAKDILTNETLLLEAGLELPYCLQKCMDIGKV
ncbi:MAG: cbiO2 [Anaerocolumna sp.]|jgi:cobalt/nickel transport system ATP-binding protein|nr:cbiO2 [Anaerocolumna sp.]